MSRLQSGVVEPGGEARAQTTADPLVGRLLDGRYRLDAALARGGMATVYTATDTRLDREVAVKVMHRALADDPDFVARFTREARAAARLSSAEVVSVYDQGTDGATGLAYLVMEHVRGGTLRDLLRTQGAQAPARAVALLEPVLRALAAAHAGGLVHRDVKPENVLLGDDGRIKVADFGLARAVEASTLTATTGLMMGTAAYMAPEQVDTGEADPRSDVYAAGVVLFELLTGAPPYGGNSSVRVAYRHVHEDVPAPSTLVAGIPPSLDELVVRATRRDPAARPPDAGAFLAELQHVRELLPVVPPQAALPTTAVQRTMVAPRPVAPPAPPARARARRGPLVGLVVALAAVAALLGGWYLGARSVAVPRVLGVAAETATQRVEAAGFRVRTRQGFSETVPAGAVADQDPDPRREARKGSTVTLVLSKGPDRRVLPPLVGLSQEAATDRVTRLGLRVGTVSRAYSSRPVGQVVAVGAPVGTALRPGSPVNLTVSKGVELLRVPSTVGRTQADAGRTLEDAGFRTAVDEVFSETVDKGAVVAQDPPGGELPRGGRVTLQVSKGPERIVVPDLSGLTDAQAKARLEGLGLKGRGVTPPFFGGDTVSRQDPSPGSRVKRGSTVSYLLT
ncbi:MAG: serine/threonine protein kinase [Frankiales bacterium]|nr:serine/threonine protein kinase [Frankiales bacterium]